MIENCKDSNKTASIILVDIDNFKNINDEFGHSIGDDVLKNIATTIKEAMPVEAIVGRFGGDEFAAVIPYNLSDSIQIAQLIRDKINPINHKNKRSISYSVSIGIAEIDKEKCNLRNWFDSADQYLYKAKSKGKNQIYYNK
jgi:diguanylate cyclase